MAKKPQSDIEADINERLSKAPGSEKWLKEATTLEYMLYRLEHTTWQDWGGAIVLFVMLIVVLSVVT